MTSIDEGGLAARAASLRTAFDRSFAAPRRAGATAEEDFLAIRIGAEACALRLAEIAGLHADKKITRLPGADAALLGIAGFRGVILPVYSLCGLLGRPVAGVPRWLAVAAVAPIALGFEAFEFHLRSARDTVLPRPDLPPRAAERQFYARDHVHAGAAIRPVIDLEAVLAAIENRRSETTPRKEE